MKNTQAINVIQYEVTAKELTLINKTYDRLKAYEMADYYKDLGYQNITVTRVITTIVKENVEENYEND